MRYVDIKHTIHYHSKIKIMEKIKLCSSEELEKIKKEVYNVILGDSHVGHLRLELNREQFESINLSVFINLGIIVTVHKSFVDVQNIE